ncbi:5'-3' exoribonuclease 4-like isoform X2 [Phoenix dactylifera]|uniref:5'-3' exoribonuclease n=1 Tax=Phoenix dactylifera TaxID=42345 RepID=A0A8B7BT12_PHODC|nr:5'-3' exoribonuclease 4-like isoform X2 [Phoenix dactylifera]
MGIPAFYRWLVDRYPLSVVPVVEEFPKVINGVLVPIDSSRPNPNGVEFDNLYLDMNGIIHPCFHPEDQPAPNSYEEVYKAVFKYIDHIFSLIRPRKLLYMAIDGVAPRAKMNQQRARRFRSAKDLADAAAEIEKLRDEMGSDSEKLTQSENASTLDSNVITPGTEFMASLSVALRYYIHLRLNNDPGWRGIKVILSDANVPGEGEHKIAAYIRAQRNLPGFDPNTRHCLYGLDADLIMLALATHELHFSILREDVRVARNREKAKKFGKDIILSGKEERKELNRDVNDDMPIKKFQFLNIWVLREYLAHDLRISDAPLKMDLERFIDDFVFICLFVGNDFLPHVPSLEISEGAIDLLMTVYKKEFARMGGYLTNSFKVDLERVEHFLQKVGPHESAIFRRRSQVQKEREIQFGVISTMMGIEQNKASSWTRNLQKSTKFFSKNLLNSKKSDLVIHDQVKLGEEGWKERYYAEKFEVKTDDSREKLKKHSVLKYVEGICWVMHYYYQGVCSWQWFYPYHYAPFASDFLDLKHLEIRFTLGVPFKPFDQLMGVLPAASAHALPLSYRNLMTDPSSAIIDFYPEDFELDLNGKRFSWQAICKLPFVQESRLLAELKKVEHTLTDEEKQRNSWTLDMLFVHISHPLASTIISIYRRKKDHPKLSKAKLKRKIDPEISGGMNGDMYISDKSVHAFEIYSPLGGMETITKNKTLFVYYKVPPVQEHIPRLPGGVILPKKSITKQDMQPAPVLWHEVTALRRRIYSERKKRIVEHKINHDTNSKHNILGKRKRGGRNNRNKRILEQNCEVSINNSNLGKRKRRDRGRRKKKIAERENSENHEHESNNSRRKCKENSHRKTTTAEEKQHGGSSNASNIKENTAVAKS